MEYGNFEERTTSKKAVQCNFDSGYIEKQQGGLHSLL